MAQDRLIKMTTKGDENGVGKGHIIYTFKRRLNRKGNDRKLELKKFNPLAKKHTLYKETKK